MYIVLGGTGNVGSSVAETLIKEKKEVTVITHSAEKVAEWERKGAAVAVVDVLDSDRLHEVFKRGKRLFLLNPPADPATDTVVEERRTLAAILKALEGSGIEKVVGESTYGAQPGTGLGDLGVLYEMEEGLKKMNLSATVIRAAYYMSNWAAALETARGEGLVRTFYPVDFKIPMVSPQDIGMIAAGFLTAPAGQNAVYYVEGPEAYSSAEVAEAFGRALGKPVEAVQIPREEWLPALKEAGFSDQAARSMAAMTALTLDEDYDKPASPVRGATTLDRYIEDLVSKEDKKSQPASFDAENNDRSNGPPAVGKNEF